MRSRLKFSDDSHREKVWSNEMLFFYMNLLLDEYNTGMKFGLFRNKDSYGPKSGVVEIMFHPFLWAGDWHLAVGFHKLHKIAVINCSKLDPKENAGFPIRSVLKLEEFVFFFGHKINKSSLKHPYKAASFIEPVSSINAINLLALVFTFCVTPTHLTDMFSQVGAEPRTYDVSEFYEEIVRFDRFGYARAVLGNQVMDKLVEKSLPEQQVSETSYPFELENTDFDAIFPKKTAEHFLKAMKEGDDGFIQDADVFDEVVEMIEGWCHVGQKDEFESWSMLFRESIVAFYSVGSKMEFDEEEFGEVLQSADHKSQVFPLILENGNLLLINLERQETELISNIVELSSKNLKGSTVVRTFAVRRLIEMYGWHNRLLVSKVNFHRYSVRTQDLTKNITTFFFFIHHFIHHGKFDTQLAPDQIDTDYYGVAFQSLMHRIVAGNRSGILSDYRKLVKCIS
ncbi:hypothetical protein OGAPHI_006366 [Ogataea philodendri]|uniref:Uncharacterized protein n=1 Tax=Ogataea philodendri TaxID=1378263 RepID=A0A9P8T090_9ASCO|nr:uncharacterized protein OGAPHI_006366 [Ogataea philodendri]KAH3661518.1 hypothetical protein OGAPHI_006366 [Ogataea philodendri]